MRLHFAPEREVRTFSGIELESLDEIQATLEATGRMWMRKAPPYYTRRVLSTIGIYVPQVRASRKAIRRLIQPELKDLEVIEKQTADISHSVENQNDFSNATYIDPRREPGNPEKYGTTIIAGNQPDIAVQALMTYDQPDRDGRDIIVCDYIHRPTLDSMQKAIGRTAAGPQLLT